MTTEYQQAVLQAMSIPLFVRTVEELASDEKAQDPNTSVSENRIQKARTPVDENAPFVQKVLKAIGFDTLQEANLQWLIEEDAALVSFSGTVLLTPELEGLQSPEMKKKLWLAIQHLRRQVP